MLAYVSYVLSPSFSSCTQTWRKLHPQTYSQSLRSSKKHDVDFVNPPGIFPRCIQLRFRLLRLQLPVPHKVHAALLTLAAYMPYSHSGAALLALNSCMQRCLPSTFR